MRETPLLDLPPELLIEIARLLDAKSLVALQETCQACRQALVSLQWSHFTLSTRYNARIMPQSADTNLTHGYTFHRRTCNVPWVMNLTLNSEYSALPTIPPSVLSLIKVMTLDLPFSWVVPLRSWWPTVAEEFTITGQLLDSMHPDVFKSLQLIEVRTDHAYSCSPLIRGLLKKFANVRFNLEVDQGITCIAIRLFDSINTGNVKTISLSLSSASNARKFANDIGKSRLLSSIERCDLCNTSFDYGCVIDGHDLRQFLSQTHQLKYLAISRFGIRGDAVGWVPDSLQELMVDSQQFEWVGGQVFRNNLSTLTVNAGLAVYPLLFPRLTTLYIDVEVPRQLESALLIVETSTNLRYLRLGCTTVWQVLPVLRSRACKYLSVLILSVDEIERHHLGVVCETIGGDSDGVHGIHGLELYVSTPDRVPAAFTGLGPDCPDVCWPALYCPASYLYKVDTTQF